MAKILRTDGSEEQVVLSNSSSERLAQFQQIVGGYIEMVSTKNGVMVVNEEGKLHGLPFNKAATAIYNTGDFSFDPIVGDAVLLTAQETRREYEDND